MTELNGDLTITADDIARADADPKKFSIGSWLAGAARTTRTVEVCGRPDLMGEIEELKFQLEKPAPEFEDTRVGVADPRLAMARRLEEAREEMLASVVPWKFKGISDDVIDEIKKAAGEDAVAASARGELGEFDYRVWAAQVVTVNGEPVKVTWEQLRDLHTALGSYFMQTIARTANKALQAEGVDVPFSLASSAIIAKSSRP